ncbi:zinc-dependent metalloprotease [Chitinophaga caeni]|uniref:Zinc-dependent metalloprotease n=1 Tax=Chitinophaga caeni TaxID=2029983 RepID=A0A291QZ47_9BACT|nr:zinc-dependent metalloprotease [Chitinophaga caeni]ATL49218.1 zinc-dependent metalloprotease [Chitinophaga caeni]
MKCNKILCSIILLVILQVTAKAQTIPLPSIPLPPGASIGEPKIDTVKKPEPAPDPRLQIKPYREVIGAGYVSKQGMFDVHQKQDTVYFELPKQLLNRDIQVINRLVKGPAGSGVYAGEELASQTIRFERSDLDSSIRLVYVTVYSMAQKGSKLERAVKDSYSDVVAYQFPIKSYGKDSSIVIEASPYIKAPGSLFNEIKNDGINAVMDNKSFKDFLLESVQAYPINVEFVTFKNATGKGIQNIGLPPGVQTSIAMNTSFILLPGKPMPLRSFDKRVGYFADFMYFYADDQQQVEQRSFIQRWRLEPKPQDLAKYKKGILVEPAKPIVIYIDPATPKKWRPYLIAGVNDWQKAFEQAGFKNAIIAKEWENEDSALAHLNDARYSFIRYLPSEVTNAYGPNIHDPRTGEIIQTQIGWYHNVMKLLRNWYMIQAAVNDPAARKMKFDDKLMGELIRFVSSHEVGHTLGLRHNFGSSSKTPVDSLRSISYLRKHGHTASIMDYARFNYVAQPEDHIPQELLFPGIHEYDKWAIEWGYRYNDAASFEEDKKMMNRLITERLAKNPRLWFGDGETVKEDPRCQTEDLGDNNMKANTYGIKNLQRLVQHLEEWTQVEGGIYQGMAEMYAEVKKTYTRYVTHVMRNIASVEYTPMSESLEKETVAPVTKAQTLEALDFFDKQVFTTPDWLLDPKVINKIGTPEYPDFVMDIQVKTLNTLLGEEILHKIMVLNDRFGAAAITPDAYLEAVENGLWRELSTGKITSMHRRNLQKAYVGNLQAIVLSDNPEYAETDITSIVRHRLKVLKTKLQNAQPAITDAMTKIHIDELLSRIEKVLDNKLKG